MISITPLRHAAAEPRDAAPHMLVVPAKLIIGFRFEAGDSFFQLPDVERWALRDLVFRDIFRVIPKNVIKRWDSLRITTDGSGNIPSSEVPGIISALFSSDLPHGNRLSVGVNTAAGFTVYDSVRANGQLHVLNRDDQPWVITHNGVDAPIHVEFNWQTRI